MVGKNGKITWTNERRKLSELIPWPRNPRQIKTDQAKRLVESFDQFGQVETIAIGPDGDIYNGHQRLNVLAQQYGKDYEIEVRVSDRALSEKEREKLTIFLHKGAAGEWDFDTLANEFELDDLLEWGFDKKELDIDLWAGNQPEDPGAQIDKAEELREKWQTSTGQLWRLGEHRLIVGDCTDRAVVERVMQGEKAALTFTSPPYWVGKEYETQKTVEEIESFINLVAVVIAKYTREDESRIVINTSTGFTTSFDKRKKRQTLLLIDKWTNAFYELGWNLRHIRHWLKQGQLASISAKADMIDQHCEWFAAYENDDGNEILFNDRIEQDEVTALMTYYNARGRGRGRGQESLGGNNKNAKSWALRSYWDDIHGEANQSNHCAAFPLEIVERHLVIYTQKDEIMFEPFSGSGTTIIAGERFKRKVRAIDIDASYCAVAIDRWNQMTGGIPELLDSQT